MKIPVTAPPPIYAAPWLRRYATELIAIALVALATLGAGIAEMLYTSAAPRASVMDVVLRTNAMLDQHERRGARFGRLAAPQE
jgi:hypothetical protein